MPCFTGNCEFLEDPLITPVDSSRVEFDQNPVLT